MHLHPGHLHPGHDDNRCAIAQPWCGYRGGYLDQKDLSNGKPAFYQQKGLEFQVQVHVDQQYPCQTKATICLLSIDQGHGC